MRKKSYYKLAKPDGWDFYTGKTINYRDNIGKVIKCPNVDAGAILCTNTVIHASKNPNDCFIGAKIPCSAFEVTGKPLVEDKIKCGFKKLKIIKEIDDLDKLFGWKYSEVINPIHPFKLNPPVITEKHIELLKTWASVRASVWASVRASVGASVGASVWDSIGASVWDSVWASVRASVRDSVGTSVGDSVRASVWASVWASVGASVWDSVGASVWDSVWGYIGSFFPKIKVWKYIECHLNIYPFQSAVDLWKMGLVPSFDGKLWRLHGGEKGKILYTSS